MYYAVILAGGTGTRLWPLSRRDFPKQALKLVGDKTMYQYAVDRISPIFPPERILVVTTPKHAEILQKQNSEIPIDNIIIEPEGRGTAAAIGLVSIHLINRDPQAWMVILTADHFIKNESHFCDVLKTAETIARDGNLVTLGIQPTFASTGFGYIQQGEKINEQRNLSVYEVKKFVEKPNLAMAKKMLQSGIYSWNSGMFVWQASQILSEFERQMPQFFNQLMLVKEVLSTSDYETVVNNI